MNIAQEKLKVPAIILIVLAALGILYNILSAVMSLLGGGAAMYEGMIADPEMQQMMAQMSGGVLGVVFAVIYLALGVVVILGALKMMKGESYGLAMAAAIIACIPCTYNCCIGFPVGIWALVLLLNDEVKQAFNQGAA
ncbi:MAG: hypothetical protein KDK30_02680 [Leptospiraceae bacterium]|nr:hypothetical protein [Leptospiraceae bacterium]MCB1321519.1 hypothetical protein [Leptospiraceae bacterium]